MRARSDIGTPPRSGTVSHEIAVKADQHMKIEVSDSVRRHEAKAEAVADKGGKRG
jgi:hypothetical protein